MTLSKEPIDAKPRDSFAGRALADSELEGASGGRNFSLLANSSHTSVSEAGEALKSVAQK
jgi:hypothetical protein